MPSRSLFASSLLLACFAGAAIVGCAAPTADDDASVVESTDELTAAAKPLAGKYFAHAIGPGRFARLTLNADGTYAASTDVCDMFALTDPTGADDPCLSAESGKWGASRSGGKLRLRLRPEGAPSRSYPAQKNGDELTLTRDGDTQTLTALPDANACLDDTDCGADEACSPKFCFMYCEVNDPYCCGPSFCAPKEEPPPPPPPPPSCLGAWLDQNGLCRTPADGAYPSFCCVDL